MHTGDKNMKSSAELLSQYCLQFLDINQLHLSDEYYYNSFPFAVIDAIFSIGVRYSSTRATVIKYCDYFNLKRIRDTEVFPQEDNQHTISELIANMCSVPDFAGTILKNRQRTSSYNGILKAEAVLLWAKIFQKYDIETLQCFNQKYSADVERELREVKGQHSGISVVYLKMLCGDDNCCKPDRHILRFISDCLNKSVSLSEAVVCMENTCELLREVNASINMRLLDHAIWKYMSQSTGGVIEK